MKARAVMPAPGPRWSLRTCVTLFLLLSCLSCGLVLYRVAVMRERVGSDVRPQEAGKATTFLMIRAKNRPDYSSHSSAVDSGNSVQRTFFTRRCSPRTNVVFIKVHKAGSTTVTCILQRFGFQHNLTFMLPRNHKSDLGWPNLIKVEDYIPSADGRYNLVVDHTVYNRPLMEGLMPDNTAYVTVLRHPLAQIKSVFNWYKIKYEYGIRHPDPLGAFLKDPDRYEAPYVISRNHRLPHSFTKNFMAFDLGFPLGLSGRKNSAKEFVRKVDRELDFVLILEHLNESLVMLRRRMCWTTKDILYDLKPRNLKSYPEKFASSLKGLEERHRNWSNVDYELYKHFNRSLWEQVAKEGPDFTEEVRNFKHVVTAVAAYCDAGSGSGADEHHLLVEQSKWSEAFTVDAAFCTKLRMQWQDWYQVLKKTHRLPPDVSSATRETIGYPGLLSISKRQAAQLFGIEP
ncbi:GAL3ST1 [Branchiostoma lanceolatum]|uniref:GAL3ST1 protein n=1 Tax=Branchiostoma lanceolatum TaxID=7740 RepID=A0A8J9WGK1_BRALA|nr:GAL3ST1 [Branchiostoma lanceolatum]